MPNPARASNTTPDTTDPNDEAARQLAAVGVAPPSPEERAAVTEAVRKAVRSGVFGSARVRPANDQGSR